MKRSIILSIVTMFAISNYAQIETYESVSPQNMISGGKAKTWQERKSQRLESIQKQHNISIGKPVF